MTWFKRKPKFRPQEGVDDPSNIDEIDGQPIPEVMDVDYDPDDLLEDGDELELEDEQARALENLDVETHWNKKFTQFEDFLNSGGLMTTVTGNDRKRKIKLLETITRAEQDIISIKLSMVSMEEGIKIGRELLNKFRNLRTTLGTRTYARLILGLRYSCTKEVDIGFHEPSFSEWDIDEEWVDEEYLRRLQGIDVASAEWAKGVDK